MRRMTYNAGYKPPPLCWNTPMYLLYISCTRFVNEMAKRTEDSCAARRREFLCAAQIQRYRFKRKGYLQLYSPASLASSSARCTSSAHAHTPLDASYAWFSDRTAGVTPSAFRIWRPPKHCASLSRARRACLRIGLVKTGRENAWDCVRPGRRCPSHTRSAGSQQIGHRPFGRSSATRAQLV